MKLLYSDFGWIRMVTGLKIWAGVIREYYYNERVLEFCVYVNLNVNLDINLMSQQLDTNEDK
jgi:hypothetical protein